MRPYRGLDLMPERLRAQKAWGGRFAQASHPLMEEFTASIAFDKRLAPYDIQGSIAHCRMLTKQKLLSRAEGEKIIKGLRAVGREIAQDRFTFSPADEDIHMAIEKRLIKKVGSVGGKLHTARSRNDQVV